MRMIFVDDKETLDTRYLNGREVLVGTILSTLHNKPMTRVVLITSSRKTVRVNVFTDNQGRLKLKEGNLIYWTRDNTAGILNKDHKELLLESEDTPQENIVDIEISSNVIDIVNSRRLFDIITKYSNKVDRSYIKGQELKFTVTCRDGQYLDLLEEFKDDDTITIVKIK